jgi:hypothetical protein
MICKSFRPGTVERFKIRWGSSLSSLHVPWIHLFFPVPKRLTLSKHLVIEIISVSTVLLLWRYWYELYSNERVFKNTCISWKSIEILEQKNICFESFKLNLFLLRLIVTLTSDTSIYVNKTKHVYKIISN